MSPVNEKKYFMGHVELTINGEKKIIPSQDSLTIESLLKNYINLVDQKGIAFAINGNVVPKKEWCSYTLKNNDNILIIQATQGG